MREASVLIGLEGEPIYWHDPEDRTGIAIPDSRAFWKVFWEHRNVVQGTAHSHPGQGFPGPSYEDVTTFSATERAFGRKYTWWIITEDRVAMFRWAGPDKHTYRAVSYSAEPVWVPRLRELSYS